MATRKIKATIDCSSAESFWDALHHTYSDSRYCDLTDLPQDIQDTIFDQKNLEFECSSYTGGQHAAFLRGRVTVDDDTSFDYEVSFGSIYNEDMYDENGNFTGDDEDAYYESVAAEYFACSDAAGLTVYFTES